MGLSLKEFYKMSIEDAIKRLDLSNVKVNNDADNVVSIELKYENKEITQATKKEGKSSKW